MEVSWPRRGDVYLTVLDPTVGREMRNTRPCLIVSPDEINARLFTIAVVPMTTGNYPHLYRVTSRFQGRMGYFVVDQVRAISPQRLARFLGRIETDRLASVLARLRGMFAE